MTTDEISKTKIKALEIARDMKPLPTYTGYTLGNHTITPNYDLLTSAEAIYQWIIKS